MNRLFSASAFGCVITMLLHFNVSSFAQSARAVSALDGFMKSQGVKIVADMAHALNTYSEGTYSISGNTVTMEVLYTNGSTEVLKAHYDASEDYFDNVYSVSGDESGYSFMAIKTFIDMIDPSNREKMCMEKFFRTSLSSMSAKQLAAAFLTDAWWKWNNKSCPN